MISAVNATLASQLALRVPVLNVTDATFEVMLTAHEFYARLDERTAARADEDELHSIVRSVHNSFSSHWAANSAITYYGARAEDVSVISWGCNFDNIPATEARSSDRMGQECRLLFIGGEWVRKGGDVVCAAADLLAAKNIPIRVDLVGTSPMEGLSDKPWLHHHGYLSKADHAQSGRLRSLMRDADLLFLPTRKDCTPMVFAEANAFGTPALTRNVGGVADVVHDGVNGIVLPEDADTAQFADAIEALWNSPDRYRELRASARREYETRLNWDAWAARIAKVIRELAASGRI